MKKIAKKTYSKPKFTQKKVSLNLFFQSYLRNFPDFHIEGWAVLAQSCPPGSCSDKRLKQNIVPLSHALEKIQNIKGVSFSWNQRYKKLDPYASEQRQIGLIAQDVEKSLPELVTKVGKEHYRTIYYDKMTAILVEAVKELKFQNEKLQKRVYFLEHNSK